MCVCVCVQNQASEPFDHFILFHFYTHIFPFLDPSHTLRMTFIILLQHTFLNCKKFLIRNYTVKQMASGTDGFPCRTSMSAMGANPAGFFL